MGTDTRLGSFDTSRTMSRSYEPGSAWKLDALAVAALAEPVDGRVVDAIRPVIEAQQDKSSCDQTTQDMVEHVAAADPEQRDNARRVPLAFPLLTPDTLEGEIRGRASLAEWSYAPLHTLFGEDFAHSVDAVGNEVFDGGDGSVHVVVTVPPSTVTRTRIAEDYEHEHMPVFALKCGGSYSWQRGDTGEEVFEDDNVRVVVASDAVVWAKRPWHDRQAWVVAPS